MDIPPPNPAPAVGLWQRVRDFVTKLSTKKKLIGTGSMLVLLAIILIAPHLKIDLFRTKASNPQGPDAVLLYGQDLGVPAGVNLNDPAIQKAIFDNVKGGYGKLTWDWDQLEMLKQQLPPFPPERGTLYWNEILTGPGGIKAPVEGGFISMVINAVDASDDILADSFIPGIIAKDPQLTPDQALQAIVPPLDATVSAPELVYHAVDTGFESPPIISPPPGAFNVKKQSRLANLKLALEPDVSEAPTQAPAEAPAETPAEAPVRAEPSQDSSSVQSQPLDQSAGSTTESSIASPSVSEQPTEPPAGFVGSPPPPFFSPSPPPCPVPGLCDQAPGKPPLPPGYINSFHLAYRFQIGEEQPYVPGIPAPPGGGGGREHLVGQGVQQLIGTGTGLAGTYYCHIDWKVLERTDPTINFDWGAGAPFPSCPLPPANDYFNISWMGKLEPVYSEPYTICADVDDLIYVDVSAAALHISNVNQPPGEYCETANLSANYRYDISVVYKEKTGNAHVKLYWSSPSTPKQIIPKSQLYVYGQGGPLFTKQPESLTILEGMRALFDVTVDGGGPMTYQWQKNGVDIPGAIYSTYTILTATAGDAGAYRMTAKNALGTATSNDATLSINQIQIPGGAGVGLVGYYYNDTTLTDLAFINFQDPGINFNWGLGHPPNDHCDQRQHIKCGVQLADDHFSVRWYGEVYIPVAGTYIFQINSNDGARLWIDGKSVADNWYLPAIGAYSKPITFDSPGKHTIRVDYWEGTGNASVRLAWMTAVLPGAGQGQVIPKQFLFPLEFKPPTPNVKVGDIVWVDAITGEIIDTISAIQQ